jgi:hypothetical protein
VLVSAHDGGVNHHVLVIVIARQLLENALENPTLRPSTEALMDDLPITKALRQITPRDASPISVQNSFNEQSVVGRSAAYVAFATRQKILDPVPLVVA